MSSRARIAFFGGTFDPPHRAHIELLKQVQSEYHFDKIWIIPSKFPPGKTPLADYSQRLAWAKKVFVEKAYEVSDLEASAEQSFFAKEIFSRLSLKAPDAEYCWILGEDQFKALPYWHQIDDYASQLQWLVLCREADHRSSWFLGSRRLQRRSCAYRWAKIKPMHGISSTEIREKVSKDRSLLDLVPEEIRDEVQHVYQQQGKKG